MTSEQQQEHCEHECICMGYASTNAYGYPCTRNTGLLGTVVTAPCEHDTRSRPHPAPKTQQECENRNCLECPLWEGCHVMEEMPMCARATYENVAKNAARQSREDDIAALDSLVETRKSRYMDKDEPEERREFLRGVYNGAHMAKSILESLRHPTTEQEQPK